MEHVGEIHLAGHAEDTDDAGERLLIDAHDRAVIADVWQLFRRAIGLSGPRPTLIEWDNDIPSWHVLMGEALQADAILSEVGGKIDASHYAEAVHDAVA